jgi:hypothetical protein
MKFSAELRFVVKWRIERLSPALGDMRNRFCRLRGRLESAERKIKRSGEKLDVSEASSLLTGNAANDVHYEEEQEYDDDQLLGYR